MAEESTERRRVSTARDEQETTLTRGRTENVVRIWSNHLPDVRKLRKDSRVTQIDGDEFSGNFTIPVSDFHPIIGFRRKKRELTPEQRAEAAARLKNAREAKN